MKRYFNTSGPNIPDEHYTLKRDNLVKNGLSLVEKRRYFTIWAPRQTGKSTYFRLLATELEKIDYKVLHINLENYLSATEESFLENLVDEFSESCNIEIPATNFSVFSSKIKNIKTGKCVLIVDEIEGLNPEIFGQFLHTIRNLYHFRDEHCLKSVILVGVTNIVGVVQDHASPFNIADNLPVPYFTREEVFELLGMHEQETGQLFEQKVKEQITYITAGQPGLVNAFAYKLVEDNPDKKEIEFDDYLIIEAWYRNEAIDKNIGNIINKANEYRSFVESLLFTERKIPFKINRESIKFLHTNGIIRKNGNGYVEFWVPLYKKCLHDAFYPYFNSESDELLKRINLAHFFIEQGRINFDKLVAGYKDYVKRRGFRYFREKDPATGQWKNIKEAAMIYSFEAYIQTLLQILEGKSYLEPHAGLGNSDLIINVNNEEYVIEAKIYRDGISYEKGKKQLAYYCNSISVKEGIYLVFIANHYKELRLQEKSELINDVLVKTYLVYYDTERDF